MIKSPTATPIWLYTNGWYQDKTGKWFPRGTPKKNPGPFHTGNLQMTLPQRGLTSPLQKRQTNIG
jgi:hypothetical protein